MGSSGGIPAGAGGTPPPGGILNSGRGVPIAGQGPPSGPSPQFGAAQPSGQIPDQLRNHLAMLMRSRGVSDPRQDPRAAMGMHRGGPDLGMGAQSQWGGPQGMGSALMGGGGGGAIPYDPNIDGPQKLRR